MARIILFNKPYGVLSQFTDESGHAGLAGYIPLPGFYAAGRLDADSEGLLILTDDGALQHRLAHPRHKLPKTYWAQVEGMPDEAALTRLRQGVDLGDFVSRPAQARILAEPAELWPREPPIRYRRSVPTSWLELVLVEGKNRQVRRMTAKVGLPTLRLVRWRIGEWSLDGLAPGKWRLLDVDMETEVKREVNDNWSASSGPTRASRLHPRPRKPGAGPTRSNRKREHD